MSARRPRTCDHCGQPFTPTRQQRYCTPAHRQRAYAQRRNSQTLQTRARADILEYAADAYRSYLYELLGHHAVGREVDARLTHIEDSLRSRARQACTQSPTP